MTLLNLHERPALKPKQDRLKWKLELETQDRETLVQVSRFLAQGIEPRFLQDMSSIPIIAVSGTFGGGKSMVVEAMMKTLLDQCDPLDMLKPGAPRTMFIEGQGAEAVMEYCYASGTNHGASIILGFDRITEPATNARLRHAFKKAVANASPVPAGGAIFSSNSETTYSNPWIVVHMEGGMCDGWRRVIDITVNATQLKTSPQFQACWRQLYHMAVNDQVFLLSEKMSDKAKSQPEPVKVLFGPNYITKKADPDLQFLKFAYMQPVMFGMVREDIAGIVADIADTGDVERTRNFLSWLHEQNQDDMISTVVSKCSTGHILHAGLAGKPNIPVFDILSGFQASDFKDKIAREAFSAAACQKKGSVYNAFYDAVKNKDSQRAVIILRIAAYLPPQKREEFFKQALCSSRPEPPVLQHLYEQRRSELLNCILVHTFNLGKTSVQIKKLMEALKAGPSAPLPPFNEMMNGVEGSKPGSPEMKIA